MFAVGVARHSLGGDGLCVVGWDGTAGGVGGSVGGAGGRFASLGAAMREFDRRMALRSDPYPLGESDSFRIVHGEDYAAFFRRMGETVNVRACLNDQGAVVASGCGVLRRLPPSSANSKDVLAWYVCDLRVDPAHRGRRLPARMLASTLALSYWKCNRAFAITMETDPLGRVGRLADRVGQRPWWWLPSAVVDVRMKEVCRLAIFSLSAKKMAHAERVLLRMRGPLFYRSLRGVKDLVLTSTGKPMPLLHVNFAETESSLNPHELARLPNEQRSETPRSGFRHMFCVPDRPQRHALTLIELEALGIRPQTHARVLAYNMDAIDFAFVQTSEI